MMRCHLTPPDASVVHVGKAARMLPLPTQVSCRGGGAADAVAGLTRLPGPGRYSVGVTIDARRLQLTVTTSCRSFSPMRSKPVILVALLLAAFLVNLDTTL